jgi:DNA-binding transcriptional LysR family regulator
MADLERNVGAALVSRTTRAVVLTDVGRDYLERTEPLLDALDEADLEARGSGELRGTLRIGVSSSFGVREIIPSIASFTEHHPELCIHLVFDDQHQNLIVENVDVAFRFGVLADSSAVARLLSSSQRLILAAPDYLTLRGWPKNPHDLSKHSVIVGPGMNMSDVWIFENDSQSEAARIEGRISASTNEGAVAAAVNGLGIVSTVIWGCRKELEERQLVPLLTDWRTQLVQLHAVFPPGRSSKAASRAFVEHLRVRLVERQRASPS